MSPEPSYSRAVRSGLMVALLVVFFFSSRIARWLPQSTAFVVVFVCAALSLAVWMSGIAGQRGAAEREIYLHAVRRLAAWVRPKRRRG